MYNRSVNTRLRLMDRNGHALSQFLRRGGELTDAVILALYGGGEQGGFYDPYDLTDEKLAWVAANPSHTSAQFMAAFPNHTLFQDARGTIPVTGHLQPVGLVLDKRFGGVRGENMISGSSLPLDGNISRSSSLLREDGYWEITTEATSYGFGAIIPTPLNFLEFGKFYEFEIDVMDAEFSYDVSFAEASNFNLSRGSVFPISRITGPRKTIIHAKDPNRLMITLQGVDSPTIGSKIVLKAAIRELQGIHASQPLSASRALWQNNNGIKTFYRDPVDDALNVTLPAATYTRIAANTGTGYATNTVVHGGGALNILGSGEGNSAGYILIDRVLTATEAANVETLFNTRAGV